MIAEKPWLALIGHRASGKSSLGAGLAQEMGLRFIDQDLWVRRRVGQELSTYFGLYGEAKFRQEEERVLFSFPRCPLLLATGGGVVENPLAVKFLRERAILIYLEVPCDELIRRREFIVDPRPLLHGAKSISEEMRAGYDTRAKLYEQACDLKWPWNKGLIPAGIMSLHKAVLSVYGK
jgi:shikimate kinase